MNPKNWITGTVIPPLGFKSCAWRKTRHIHDKAVEVGFIRAGEEVSGWIFNGEWLYSRAKGLYLPRFFVSLPGDVVLKTIAAAYIAPIIAQNPKEQTREILTVYDSFQVFKLDGVPFLQVWIWETKTNFSVVLVALIYIQRVCKMTGLQLHNYNIYKVLCPALLVAKKWMVDIPFCMKRYARILRINVKQLLMLERIFLRQLDWDIHVNKSEQEELLTKASHILQNTKRYANLK